MKLDKTLIKVLNHVAELDTIDLRETRLCKSVKGVMTVKMGAGIVNISNIEAYA